MVRLEELTRRFGDLIAVDRLSCAVKPGELFGLVGPDGAGKTTTLRMLAGVLRPSAGDAWVNGDSVTHDPERVKHGIGYMSQRFGLYTDLSVLENLRFYADLYRVPQQERPDRLARLFRFSNLEPFQDRLAGQLSGGMKQKLGLSCALIHEPDVLLLDEPTFGVDPISRRDLWLIIHEMVARGVTVVVSTAYMDEAERFDRVALLHRGRLVALDTPDALRRGLPGVLLAVATDDVRRARDVLDRLPGVRRAALYGTRVHVSIASETDRTPVLAALEQAGCRVDRADIVLPSMEDVVMEYMAEQGSRGAEEQRR
jgi:ABC-2 type transport system ATP-binding protein